MPSLFPPSGVLSFGYVAPNATPQARLDMANFWIEVSVTSGLEIMVAESPSYEALARAFAAGEVDFAWLPPIPLVALERRKAAIPLVSHHRDGSSHFHSVLVAHRASELKKPEQLIGKRAAWVDPYSASGYVLPRIELARLGIDPKTAFSREKFYRSHAAAVRAVIDRRADFAGTWVGRDTAGALVRAPWTEMVGGGAIRIIQTFGVIPSDTIAARPGLIDGDADKVQKALMATSKSHPHLVRDIFGVDEFRPWTPVGYDILHESTSLASSQGLLEGDEKGDPSSRKLVS
jgi:phosphonate transport system substrate-binding protein